MSLIAPSILSADFCHLAEAVEAVSNADWLHVDVMDGRFVPNLTFGYPMMEALGRCTTLPLDVHLMIQEPLAHAPRFAQAGASSITFHLEACPPPVVQKTLEALAPFPQVKRGLALRPITKAEAILPYLEGLDMVLVMTVEPGYSGQKFLEGQLDTIAQVRAYIQRYNPRCLLEVDGGINADTAPKVLAAGADVLVAGSAVYGAPDPRAAISLLRGEKDVG